ncbi:MAG: M28 family peptidase [Oscillibacter sp.]|nr:M28 family peptidase [Oscillibacter sp.]
MMQQSQKIMTDFQVRKSKKQKETFRGWLCGELEAAGYAPKVEKGFAARNVVAGDPEKAKVIFSAHYDTCAVLPIPNFVTPRNMFFYLCYQMLLVLAIFVAVFLAEAAAVVLMKLAGTEPPLWLHMLLGYALCVFFCWWILDGPANKHTANDNTSGTITLLETALAMPPEDREKVCFVFFDNEEKGLFGSAAFTKAHKKAKKETPNINFDCVSDGDYIQFFPDKRMKKKNPEMLERIEAAFQGQGEKKTEVVRGPGFYPSDNKAFKMGVGVCALKHKRIIGYYMDRIHTSRDTVLEEENIQLLRDGALRLAAAEKISNQGLT